MNRTFKDIILYMYTYPIDIYYYNSSVLKSNLKLFLPLNDAGATIYDLSLSSNTLILPYYYVTTPTSPGSFFTRKYVQNIDFNNNAFKLCEGDTIKDSNGNCIINSIKLPMINYNNGDFKDCEHNNIYLDG